MYQGCIFDLDGTLINTLPALTLTTNLTLQQVGLGPVTEEQVKLFVGDGYQKQMERALLACHDEKLSLLHKVQRIYMELFPQHCMDGISPYDGIMDMLRGLKERGIKLAVLSNKPHERTVENIQGIFGKNYFHIVMGEQPGFPKKPNPLALYHICEQMGLDRRSCLYVGDTNTDMETGRAAAMDVAGVLWGFREKEELLAYQPKYLVSHPRELFSLCTKETGSLSSRDRVV